jgi:hypothetical protein
VKQFITEVSILKKKLSFIMLAFAVILIGGCGSGSDGGGSDDDVPEPLEVALDVPESADVNEKVVFTATVTQGDEKIKDADEVEFEIWEDGKKGDSEMIEAKNNGDGTYEMEKAFDRDGAFIVQVHVTARGMHNMPKKSIAVGKGAANGHGEHHDGGHHQGEHAHSDGFSMHFMKPADLQAGKDAEFTVHLEHNGQPLENAQVRFEIWQEETPGQHDWADAKEVRAGEYAGSYTFTKKGKYMIQIHVKDGKELHEHEQHELEVK